MSALKWIRCRIFSAHRFYVFKAWTFQCRELRCDDCDNRWMMHDRYQACLPWDEELEDVAKMEADPEAWWEARKNEDIHDKD